MSNGYTAVPAIIPGNLTVNGLLTVASDAGIQIGAAAPFVRLFKDSGPGLGLSINVQTDEATRDSAGTPAHILRYSAILSNTFHGFINSVGTLTNRRIDETLAQDGTAVGNTGNTTENTTRSKVIPANSLGADGALVLEWFVTGIAQGGVATTFRVKLGGTLIFSTTDTTAEVVSFRLVFLNLNATNSQWVSGHLAKATVVTGASPGIFAIDTTVDETLSCTIQNGAVGDNWTDRGWKVHALASAGAAF
jgi:hypothetical protein